MAEKGANQKIVMCFPYPGGRVGDQIVRGNVATSICAFLGPWGDVVYKIRQHRILPPGCNKTFGDWFTEDDLADVMRGAYEAQRRIKKRRCRLLWRGMLGWSP